MLRLTGGSWNVIKHFLKCNKTFIFLKCNKTFIFLFSYQGLLSSLWGVLIDLMVEFLVLIMKTFTKRLFTNQTNQTQDTESVNMTTTSSLSSQVGNSVFIPVFNVISNVLSIVIFLRVSSCFPDVVRTHSIPSQDPGQPSYHQFYHISNEHSNELLWSHNRWFQGEKYRSTPCQTTECVRLTVCGLDQSILLKGILKVYCKKYTHTYEYHGYIYLTNLEDHFDTRRVVHSVSHFVYEFVEFVIVLGHGQSPILSEVSRYTKKH
jgi:hypothetical protein